MSPFEEALARCENSVRAGWNEKTRRWSPHKSLEGGTDTLAYGHKLTAAEEEANAVIVGDMVVDLEVGLTEEDAVQLLRQDIEVARDRLKRKVKGFFQLPEKYQQILISIEFNTGNVSEKTWPSLLRAMRHGEDQIVRQEMITSYRKPSGERVRLMGRAHTIADAVL